MSDINHLFTTVGPKTIRVTTSATNFPFRVTRTLRVDTSGGQAAQSDTAAIDFTGNPNGQISADFTFQNNVNGIVGIDHQISAGGPPGGIDARGPLQPATARARRAGAGQRNARAGRPAAGGRGERNG